MAARLTRLRRDSLLRNSGYNMATTVVTALLGYLYWIVAARAYAPRDVGVAAALISAMLLAALVANLGAAPALIEFLPRRAAGLVWSRALNAALALSLVCGLVAGAVVVAALPLLAPGMGVVRADPVYALLFVGGVALWNASTTLDGAFIAERAAGHGLARNSLFATLKIPLLIAPLPGLLLCTAGHRPPPGEGILASWVLASAIACGVGVVQLSRLGRGYRWTTRGVAAEARGMLPSLAGHHLITLGGSAPMYLLPLLVTARLSATADAYFYTAWKVGGLFFMVSPAVAASLFAEGAHRPDELAGQVRRAAVAIGALLGPAALVLWPGGPGGAAILALFGPGYPRRGLPLLALLVLSSAPDAVTNVYVSVLRVRGRLWLAGGLNVGMAAVALALAWGLLPPLGIAGAGWAWLVAQLLGSLLVGAHVAVALYRRLAVRGEGQAAVPVAAPSGGYYVDV